VTAGLDPDESELNKAIQASLRVNWNPRYTPQGTDLAELQRALAASLLEGGYVPPQFEDADESEDGRKEEGGLDEEEEDEDDIYGA
jgi:hypothetical protein